MAAFLDSMVIEARLNSVWTDITADVIVDPVMASWGIKGNSAVDLVASTGTLRFTMNNNNGEYLPGLTTSVSGWGINTAVRVVLTFEGVEHNYRFYVSSIRNSKIRKNEDRVTVVCTDYIEFMARTPLKDQAVVASQTADQGIITLVSAMQTAPQATSFDTGKETFNTIFSAVTPNTRIFSEVAQLVKSEFGYFYNTKDQTNGETLVFDNHDARNGLKALDQIQSSSGDALLLETGDFLLLETGDKILLSQLEDAVFDNSMSSVEIKYGEDIVNYFKTIANPTTVTAGASTLWELGETIKIGAGDTVTFRTNYRDPTGGNRCNCLTTDATGTTKSFNTQSDGGGSDISADLTVTATFGAEGVTFSLKNNNASTGYVTSLTATGTGLLLYSPVYKEVESSASQLSYDLRVQSINQIYQQTADLGASIGEVVIDNEKDPRVDLQKVTFSANRSAALMHALLDLDVGSLVNIKEDDSEIDGYYYIQGVEFQIRLSRTGKTIIDFSWIVRKTYTKALGLSMLAIETENGTAEGVTFNYNPRINTSTRSFSAWINIPDTANLKWLMGISSSSAGSSIYISSDERVTFQQNGGGGLPGIWNTNASTVPTGEWVNIIVTRDSSTKTNQPVIYINGSSVTVNETQSQALDTTDEIGATLYLGGFETSTSVLDGKLKDFRIYDVILTSANATTIYNGGTPSDTVLNTSDLKFQAFSVKTSALADYEDVVLDSTLKVNDAIFGVIGTPYGSPTGRSA